MLLAVTLLTLLVGSVTSIHPDGEPEVKTLPLLSSAVRAAPDLMAFTGVFGIKTIFEAKVPPGLRVAFYDYTMQRHSADGALDEFRKAWKAWLEGNQEPLSEIESDEDQADPDAKEMFGLGGGVSDEGEGA